MEGGDSDCDNSSDRDSDEFGDGIVHAMNREEGRIRDGFALLFSIKNLEFSDIFYIFATEITEKL